MGKLKLMSYNGSSLSSVFICLVICLSLGAVLSYMGIFTIMFESAKITHTFKSLISNTNFSYSAIAHSNNIALQRSDVNGPATTDVDDKYTVVFPIVTLTSGNVNGAHCNCTFELPSPDSAHQQLRNSVQCSCGGGGSTDEENLIKDNKQAAAAKVEESMTAAKPAQELPWYAEGRTWHYPVRFPRCSMDACFNFSRCVSGGGGGGSGELLIYSYDVPAPPQRYFDRLKNSTWHTDDPSKACLFFVYLDSETRPHPNTLPYWWAAGKPGMNHVLITFADMWRQRGPAAETIGFASVMASDMHETIYRPGFDTSIPLPGHPHACKPELQTLKPSDRKYLLTFRGLRYLGPPWMEGVLRSHTSFRQLHNGKDVIVVTSCRHPTNDKHRERDPSLGANCAEDEALYAQYSFLDLLNTTFGLVPAGRQPNSYRFVEVLAAGTIPVLVADNYVKPFDTLIQWHRCLLQFPSDQMHLILPAIRSIPEDRLLQRQKYCIHVYETFLKDDDALLRASVASAKARFYGALPFEEESFLDVRRRRRQF